VKGPQSPGRPRAKIAAATPFAMGMILLLQAGAPPAMADSNCAPQEVASLPADFGHGVVGVDISINGEAIKFVLDTGDYFSEVTEALVHRLGLSRESRTASMISRNGTREKDIVDVPEFKIGQVKGSDYKFLVTSGGGDGTNGTYAGQLGQDLLSAYDIELDPTENRVNFFLPNPCDGKAVYWWDEHFELPLRFETNRTAEAHVTLDGQDFDAYINTGSSRSTVDSDVAHRALNVPSDIQVTRDAKGNQDGPRVSYTFKELVFGPVTLRNPKLDLEFHRTATLGTGTHIRETIASDTPVAIGMDILGKFHTLISYTNRKIYFTLPKERKLAQTVASKP
jgi:predicted aspartyl protease